MRRAKQSELQFITFRSLVSKEQSDARYLRHLLLTSYANTTTTNNNSNNNDNNNNNNNIASNSDESIKQSESHVHIIIMILDCSAKFHNS